MTSIVSGQLTKQTINESKEMNVKKNVKKTADNFQHYVKKFEPQVEKWFSL